MNHTPSFIASLEVDNERLWRYVVRQGSLNECPYLVLTREIHGGKLCYRVYFKSYIDCNRTLVFHGNSMGSCINYLLTHNYGDIQVIVFSDTNV